MDLEYRNQSASRTRRPVRKRRFKGIAADPGVVDVGPGTKWNNPFKRADVMALVRTETDIAAAVDMNGWKAGAVALYRDFLREEGLDPRELRGKDLSCTCKPSEPCHADVLIEMANS